MERGELAHKTLGGGGYAWYGCMYGVARSHMAGIGGRTTCGPEPSPAANAT